MANIWRAEKPRNDVDRIFSYAPGTFERDQLLQQLDALKGQTEEIPLIIAGRAMQTDAIFEVRCPHDHQCVLARAHQARAQEFKWAIEPRWIPSRPGLPSIGINGRRSSTGRRTF